MKYKIYSLSLLLLIFNNVAHSPYLHANDIENFDNDDLDQFFDESGDLTVNTDSLRACQMGEADLWIALFDNLKNVAQLDIAELFNEDFYKVTHIPSYRNVLNYPNNFIVSYQVPESEQITFHIFWNQFFKKNYTTDRSEQLSKYKILEDDGQRLGSYLNIENGTLLKFLETATNTPGIIPGNLNALKSINFPILFTTLANAKLEQRRLGIVAHYYKEFNPKTFLEIKLPILYEITNLNYTEDEKKLLRRELSDFQNKDFNEVEFGKQHLVMDAFGTGTLDITLKCIIWETDNKSIQLGISLFAPTDRRWVTGLYGTYFTPKDQTPILRLCEIVDTDNQRLHQDAKEKLECFFFGALDHLSSAILQCQMGYNNHTAFALKVLPYWQINDRLQFDSVYIFEYLLPHEHPRFFAQNEPEIPFSKQYANTISSEVKLKLLEDKLAERLYPRVFTTRVLPGFLFNTISNLQFSRNKWNYTVGYNGWYKSAEKLSNIKATTEELRNINICKATNDSASQLKIFGKIHRLFETKKHTISFSLYGNVTVWNNNLGNDFTIGVSFDKTF